MTYYLLFDLTLVLYYLPRGGRWALSELIKRVVRTPPYLNLTKLHRLERYREVAASVDAALESNPSHSSTTGAAFFLRGKAYTALGRFEQAKDDLLAAKAAAPHKPEVRMLRKMWTGKQI